MYPNQPVPPPYQPQQQPQQQPPLDYLNQIAPQAPKRSFNMSSKGKIILLVLGVLILISVISIVVNVVSAAQREPYERLAARLTTSQKIVDDAQKKLKSSELRSINSGLRLYYTDAIRDLATPLKNNGIDVKKLSDSSKKKEQTIADGITERLEDARLNAIYDRTYARELAYQLATTLALMDQILATTRSKSMKEFLESAQANLEPIQKSLATYNDGTN